MAKDGPDKVKLYLNLPALERLLGGDTEAEVAARHQIVENFARHHLAELTKTEAIRDFLKKLREDAARAVRQALDDGARAYYSSNPLGQAAHDMVWQEARKAAQKVALDTLRSSTLAAPERLEALARETTEKVLREKAERLFEASAARVVRELVDRRVQQLVDAEVARRLKAALEVK